MHDKFPDCEDSDATATTIGFKDPFDLPVWRKWLITVTLACITFTVTLGSSIFSGNIAVTAHEFDASETLMLLGVSLYVLGFTLGPILGYCVFTILQIPTALANNLPGLLICRLLARSFRAALVLVSASYSDFWNLAHRGTAAAACSVASYAGPTLGPRISAIMTESQLGWRWTAWLTLILAGFFGPVAFMVVPETYGPMLRKEEKPSLQDFVRKLLVRPVLLLKSELMLLLMTIYISIVYAVMYFTFFAVPYIFIHDRGWSHRLASLPFLSMLVGILASSVLLAWYSSNYYQSRLRARGKVLPEDRLPPIMLGSILMPTGLFWLVWTSHVHWAVQVISVAFVGAGIMLIFTNGIAFIIDIYVSVSASAFAANTIVRSAAAAGLPWAAPRMYEAMGTSWATTLLAFLCVALLPAPFLFYKYDERLRRRSRFAPNTGI